MKHAATTLFWILATISLSWTCISMAIKRAEMGEFFAELCRFIMFTGLFFWLLTNGPAFANDVITSLWKVGVDAAATGISFYPGDVITLSMQVFQNTLQHVNFLQPESIVAPIVIAIIILIVCAYSSHISFLPACSRYPYLLFVPIQAHGHQLLSHRLGRQDYSFVVAAWGEASGSGNSIYPAQLINLAMQVFQNTINT